MAKSDFDYRSNQIIPTAQAKYISEASMGAILIKGRERPKPVKGIRETILEAYYKDGLLAAYEALSEYNKRVGRTFYAPQVVEKWIAEDRIKKGYNKDEGFDR